MPVGGWAGMGVGVGIGSAGRFAILAAYSGQFARLGQLRERARAFDAPAIRLPGAADPPKLAFANDTGLEHTQYVMSYGDNGSCPLRRAAVYVDKILEATKSEALPVEHSPKIEFVINSKTAKALGLPFPQSVL